MYPYPFPMVAGTHFSIKSLLSKFFQCLNSIFRRLLHVILQNPWMCICGKQVQVHPHPFPTVFPRLRVALIDYRIPVGKDGDASADKTVSCPTSTRHCRHRCCHSHAQSRSVHTCRHCSIKLHNYPLSRPQPSTSIQPATSGSSPSSGADTVDLNPDRTALVWMDQNNP